MYTEEQSIDHSCWGGVFFSESRVPNNAKRDYWTTTLTYSRMISKETVCLQFHFRRQGYIGRHRESHAALWDSAIYGELCITMTDDS